MRSIHRSPRARNDPRRFAIGLILALTLSGCAGTGPGSGDPVDGTLAGGIAARIAGSTNAEGGCVAITLVPDDRTGSNPVRLAALADSVALDLRALGVRAYPHPGIVGDRRAIHLVLERQGGRDRLYLQEQGGDVLTHFPLPGAETVSAPMRFLGRPWIHATRFDWPVIAIASGANPPPFAIAALPVATLEELGRIDDGAPSFLALGVDSLRRIEISMVEGVPVLRTRAAVPVPGSRVRGPVTRTGLGPAPIRTERLIAFAELGHASGGFVAISNEGALRYGGPRGLWGAPRPGHGTAILPVDGGFVTATDALPGERDGLVHVRIDAARRLTVTEEIDLGPDPIVGLGVLDVDGDGRDDLLVAQQQPGGCRLSVFTSGAER